MSDWTSFSASMSFGGGVAPSLTRPGGGGAGGGGTGTIQGTAGDDTLTGTAGDNTINGLGGNDTINGLGGNDTVAGGAGADTINGGDGDDTLFSDLPSPAYTFPTDNPFVPPLLDQGTDSDTLVGGAGNDTIVAGYGDSVDGGDGFDNLLISFQGATSGITFDINIPTQIIGGATITGVEAVSWVEGSNYDDHIDLSSQGFAYSTLFGMAGNDTLIGGYFTLSLDGGDGDDILDARGCQYFIKASGGAGDDIIYTPVDFSAVADGGEGNDTIYAGGAAHGGNGNDTIVVTDGAYNAHVTGDAGDDQITGSYSYEVIEGNDGADALRGLAGNDTLDGGAGHDFIVGGLGDDTLIGGADSDVFLFQLGDGNDVITDFSSGDILELDGYDAAVSITQSGTDVVIVLSDFDKITLSNIDIATVTAGLQFVPASDDVLTGGSGNDYLRGLGGNDIIAGEGGADTLVGGAGADVLNGGDGSDTLYSSDVSPPFNWPYYGAYTSPLLDRGTDVDTLNGGTGDDAIFAGYGDNVDGGDQESYGDTLFISFQGASQGVTADFREETQIIGGGIITGIENIGWVEGSNYDDYINVDGLNENGYSPFNVVLGMGGNDTLVAGTYTALLDGGDGNDIIDGRNSYYLQTVVGGDGDDTIYTEQSPNLITYGGAGNDTIFSANKTYGGDGNDAITLSFSYYGSDYNQAYGEAGNDTIIGSASADTLNGGSGDDTLTGGDGNDRFQFEAGDGHDVITDFASGDSLELNMNDDSVQSITQVGSDVVVALSDDNQITLLNTDVATVQAGLGFSAVNDLLVGTSGDDTLKGFGGDDVLVGMGGADLLDGGRGNDFLFSADSAHDSGNISNDAGLEHDVLRGGDGDDWLWAGYGDDVDGGNGYDILRLSLVGSASGVTLDTSNIAQGLPLSIGGGIIQNVEQLAYITGSDFADTLTIRANDVPLIVYAGDGDDFIDRWGSVGETYGEGGNDTLVVSEGTAAFWGGDGDDQLVSGTGADWFVGNAGNDTVDYFNAAVGMTVSLALGTASDGDGLSEVENVEGSNYADNISGDNFSNLLRGRDGDDTLAGGRGNDTLEGGSGNDTFVFQVFDGQDIIADFTAGDKLKIINFGSAQSITQVGSDVLVTLSASDQITLKNTTVATVQGGLQFVVDPPVNLVGTDGPDYLVGGSGNDRLSGGGGNDVLDGGFGADTLTGGTGDDQLFVDNAHDAVVESVGGGTDRVIASADYTLPTGAEIETLAATYDTGGASFFGPAINLTGNEFGQSIGGNSNTNTLLGMGGNDVISGGWGSDTLDGGTGNDTLTGGPGGGGDVDTFMFAKGGGKDIITDFEAGESIEITGYSSAQSITQSGTNVIVVFSTSDQITLQNTTLAVVQAGLQLDPSGVPGGGGGTPGTITGTSGVDTLNGTTGADTINGLGGNDTLNGNAGNDTLDGGTGADIMKGGAGNDIYYVDNSGDRITELSGAGTDEVRTTITQTLASNVEKGTALGTAAINLTGNTLANVLTGNSAANTLNGAGGNDTLNGGLGNDTLTGGAGRDVFLFSDVASGADKITDFVSGTDKINLHAFGITAAQVHTAVSGSNLVISVDADHNGTNDFSITLVGVTHIAASDYIF